MTSAEIWSRFGARLRAFVASRVREEADVDDLLQELFAKVHRGKAGVKDEGKLEAWLFRVARHQVIDHARSRARRPLPIPEDVAGTEAPRSTSCLEPMLERLPDPERELLRSSELDGVPQAELALRWGLSASGARSRVQRARAKLREAVLDCCRVERDAGGRPVDFTPKKAGCGCPDGAPSASPARGPARS